MRQEIGKWNQRTPRRFQTGRWHQTSQASIRGKQHLNEQTKLSDTLHNIEVLRCHVNETVRFHKKIKNGILSTFYVAKMRYLDRHVLVLGPQRHDGVDLTALHKSPQVHHSVRQGQLGQQQPPPHLERLYKTSSSLLHCGCVPIPSS